jgi:hypothetical protein
MRIVFGRRLLVAATVALLAAFIFQISFFQDNREAYLFPAVVAGVMLLLSLVSLVRESLDLCVDDFQPFPFQRQLPVLLMMAGGVALIETLGMYTTAFLILLLVTYWYSPQTNARRRLLSSLAMAAGFSVAMYLLFSLLLNVQVPRGWLM